MHHFQKEELKRGADDLHRIAISRRNLFSGSTRGADNPLQRGFCKLNCDGCICDISDGVHTVFRGPSKCVSKVLGVKKRMTDRISRLLTPYIVLIRIFTKGTNL